MWETSESTERRRWSWARFNDERGSVLSIHFLHELAWLRFPKHAQGYAFLSRMNRLHLPMHGGKLRWSQTCELDKIFISFASNSCSLLIPLDGICSCNINENKVSNFYRHRLRNLHAPCTTFYNFLENTLEDIPVLHIKETGQFNTSVLMNHISKHNKAVNLLQLLTPSYYSSHLIFKIQNYGLFSTPTCFLHRR